MPQRALKSRTNHGKSNNVKELDIFRDKNICAKPTNVSYGYGLDGNGSLYSKDNQE